MAFKGRKAPAVSGTDISQPPVVAVMGLNLDTEARSEAFFFFLEESKGLLVRYSYAQLLFCFTLLAQSQH